MLFRSAHWASQAAVIEGMAQFGAPDAILREEEMAEGLAMLARQAGVAEVPQVPGAAAASTVPFALREIYDEEIERLARTVYQRDYVTFGFGDWA